MFVTGVAVVVVLFFWYRQSCIKADEREREYLKLLKSLPNYRRLVVILSSEGTKREYFARVMRWDVPDNDKQAELWCIEGPNPDGYTYTFLWNKDDLEFVE